MNQSINDWVYQLGTTPLTGAFGGALHTYDKHHPCLYSLGANSTPDCKFHNHTHI
jgi:hypothetical protein